MLAEVLLATLAVAILLLIFYRFWFLRNPKREISKGNNIVSPADGKVASIVKIGKETSIEIKKSVGRIKTLTNDTIKQGYLILIVMNIFDMHYQKAPIDGEIVKTSYKKGRFLNAVSNPSDLKATLENEKNEIIIKTTIGKIKIIQIAGVLARRIVCFVKPNQKIIKGQNIGLIKLGSQVALIIPKLSLRVRAGQKVKSGQTIIAEYES